MQGASTDLVLWLLCVATAIAGGAMSLYAASLERKERSGAGHGRNARRLMLGSYVLMTVSIVIFAVRGLA